MAPPAFLYSLTPTNRAKRSCLAWAWPLVRAALSCCGLRSHSWRAAFQTCSCSAWSSVIDSAISCS